MSQEKGVFILGAVVEEEVELSLLELCQASDAQEHHVITWVQEGMLEPIGDGPADWRFGGDSLRRACMARRLSHDLAINPPGVALALDLLDEIAALTARLERSGIR
jgi:chaperone modulatory protein CbpM